MAIILPSGTPYMQGMSVRHIERVVNNLSVYLHDSSDTIQYCVGTAGITQGSQNGYFFPIAYCIEHLNAGVYHLNVAGSDAFNCSSSSISTILGARAKLRLLSED